MRVRKASVAGSFYPSNPEKLREFCRAHLVPARPLLKAKGVLLPHAGWIYSGALACRVLSRIEIPSEIFLIGPNHRGLGYEFALDTSEEWETPLGRCLPENGLAADLLEASPHLKDDCEAHEGEHSLEVLLPFFQTLKPKARIVPMVVGSLDFEAAREVALHLGEALAARKTKPLLAVSSDMSHYESDAATREKDRYALEAIKALDAEALRKRAARFNITMCGLMPAYMLLVMKDLLGISKATLVDYRTSGEVSGDFERVVGYAGFIFE